MLDQGQHDDWLSDRRSSLHVAQPVRRGLRLGELRVAKPIVDLRVIGKPAVAAALTIAAAYAAIIFPSLLLLPQFTVDIWASPAPTGTAIGARALPVLLLTIPVARLAGMPRFDLRWAIAVGSRSAG